MEKKLKDLNWRDNEIFALTMDGKLRKGQVKSIGCDFITFFYGDCSATIRFDGKGNFKLMEGSIEETHAVYKYFTKTNDTNQYLIVSTTSEETQFLAKRFGCRILQ